MYCTETKPLKSGTLQTLEETKDLDEALIFYGTEDVSAFLGCSIPTARQIMRRADFPLIMVGKNMRVSKKALKEWAISRHV